jgi:DHH family
MHPKLVEYTHRFKKDGQQIKFEKFFTQFSLQEYSQKLPYLFEIENFCLRLYLAKKNHQKICIYSDYDTDAVTATAVMYHGLLNFEFKKENVGFYAPNRFIEGYGINPEAIEKLSKFYDLIISVDCGINSVLEAQIILDSSNCDLIITDHHHLHEKIPKALAVVNPRLSQFYADFEEKLEERKNLFENILKNFESQEQVKLRIWQQKIIRKPNIYKENSKEFLTQSSTGVSVAWFCLVWFGYFLQDNNLD